MKGLVTTRQKVQFIEALIGEADFRTDDLERLQDILDIYKNGNEPFYDADDLKWLNKMLATACKAVTDDPAGNVVVEAQDESLDGEPDE